MEQETILPEQAKKLAKRFAGKAWNQFGSHEHRVVFALERAGYLQKSLDRHIGELASKAK